MNSNIKKYYLIFILFPYFLLSCTSESQETTSSRANGDLNETFIESGEIETDSTKYENEVIAKK
ncbi:MAG: hypothetical protein IPI31_02950 [Bacteroidetes bacterium]|nr:hypothetical protein [Bacteroidota bacterium]